MIETVTDPTLDEIDLAVTRLVRAMDKARGGRSQAQADAAVGHGLDFARSMHACLRMTRVHDLDNQAFERPLVELERLLESLSSQLGQVRLVVVEDQVYLGDQRLRVDERNDVGRALSREFLRHDCGGLIFHEPLDRGSLRLLLTCFAMRPAHQNPRGALTKALASYGLSSLELMGVFRFRLEEDETPADRGDTIELAARGATIVDQCWDNLGRRRLPDTVAVRRVVAEIVSKGESAETLLLELASSSPYASHTLRVCHVALMLGRTVGLDEGALQDLGVTALMHDMGYAAREGARPATADKPALRGFPPPFERHTMAGARLLMRQRGFHGSRIRRLLAILQHHDDYSRSEGRPSLQARILRLAEDYDNLQRKSGGGLTPPEAIATLCGDQAERYDPVLLQAFVNTLGRYPPGSVLQLVDGRVVRSRSTVRFPGSFAGPLAEVLRLADGKAPKEPAIIDLAREGQVRRVLRPKG